ncbi:hypothetical protein D9M68_46990 [compost metagenome]
MNNKQRRRLKKGRLKAKISVSLAAKLAFVEPRTWRQWEAEEDSDNARSPSPAALWSFIARSGISIPGLDPRKRKSPRGIAFTIASSKGGVGKTPITLNVAACLVEQGFQVAIVTDDLMYRLAVEDAEAPIPGSLVSRIDFYDEMDLITFPGETRQRRKQMRQRLADLQAHEEPLFRACHREEFRALEHKQRATEKFSELIARYDYVLIDMNGANELIRRFAGLVAIVIDTNCRMSVRSAGRFASSLRAIKCRETTPSYFGLLTNCDVEGVSREFEEFVGDHMELDETQYQRLTEARHATCRRRERVLEQIEGLDFPNLFTELSGAYNVATEMHELNPEDPKECDHFDSLMD